MDALWKMLENAILGGNWIAVLIVGIVIIAYIYFTNKKADSAAELAAINTRISELEVRLAENFEKDEENARNDKELADTVSYISNLVEEMYTPVTGKIIPEE